jgi:hypothetical protein
LRRYIEAGGTEALSVIVAQSYRAAADLGHLEALNDLNRIAAAAAAAAATATVVAREAAATKIQAVYRGWKARVAGPWIRIHLLGLALRHYWRISRIRRFAGVVDSLGFHWISLPCSVTAENGFIRIPTT